MATDVPQNEMQAFYAFLERRLDSGAAGLTPEQSVGEFRAYQEELQRFLQESESAFRHAETDEGRELDVDAIMERVAKRLASEGFSS